jgi:branched-subunit amino acid transport protein
MKVVRCIAGVIAVIVQIATKKLYKAITVTSGAG